MAINFTIIVLGQPYECLCISGTRHCGGLTVELFLLFQMGYVNMQKVKQSCCESLPQNSTRNGKRSWHCWQVDNEELIAAARVEAGN